MDRKKVEEHRENGWKAIDGKRLKSEPVGFCNNKVVHIEEDHVELTPNCILPYPEDRIVQLSSWETINNDGKTLQIIPLEIWNEISHIFINLGISLKEI